MLKSRLTFWKDPSPHLELCQSDHWVLGHLPDQGPSPSLIAQFGQAVSSRKCPVVQYLFHLRMMAATEFFGALNAADLFVFYPLPQYNPVSEVYEFLWLNGLIFAQIGTVNYRSVYVPFQNMSNELNLPQVDSNQFGEISLRWSMETKFSMALQRVWILM